MVIQRAVQVASLAHDGQARKNGEPFIIHPLETACILAEHKMDLDTIVAGLLHDTVEDTELTLANVEALFGPRCAVLPRELH
jgi:GTP pyrophosphokinase